MQHAADAAGGDQPQGVGSCDRISSAWDGSLGAVLDQQDVGFHALWDVFFFFFLETV